MAWKEYCAEYWLKELQESMGRCNGRRGITETQLKTASNTIQSINNQPMRCKQLRKAKSFGPCQPARTAQADIGRYFSQVQLLSDFIERMLTVQWLLKVSPCLRLNY